MCMRPGKGEHQDKAASFCPSSFTPVCTSSTFLKSQVVQRGHESTGCDFISHCILLAESPGGHLRAACPWPLFMVALLLVLCP